MRREKPLWHSWVNIEPGSEGQSFERGIIKMLLVTALITAVAGVVDTLIIGTLGAIIQPAAAFLVAMLCIWMYRTDRLHIYPLLITIALGSWAWIALMVVQGTYLRLVDPTAILLMMISGVALVLVGRGNQSWLKAMWVVLITSASSMSVWVAWRSPGRALSDAVVAATVSYVALAWVGAIRAAADANREALAVEIKRRDELVASVSHELRTPIAAVVGLLEELTRSDANFSSAEHLELLAMAFQQGQEVADIVEDLLVVARGAGGNLSTMPTQIDLAGEVATVLSVVDGEFEYERDGAVDAYADPTRTRQIVRNLMTNAIRYGGPQRRVVVEAGAEEALIEVRDNGDEIPLERQAVMFEPYERSRKDSTSTPESVGLGLTVARSLAENMGGNLTYEHDGKESLFRLAVPAYATANPPTG